MQRAIVLSNGLVTSLVALAMLPAALAWPSVAEAVARAHPNAAVDGALCFGPLVLPGVLLVSGAALRAAWERDPTAARLNAGALAVWAALAGAVGVLVQAV